MTKFLQRLRDELVRRDYAASTIRSYIQIVDAFCQHTGARLDRLTPAQLRRYHPRGDRPSSAIRMCTASCRPVVCPLIINAGFDQSTPASSCR